MIEKHKPDFGALTAALQTVTAELGQATPALSRLKSCIKDQAGQLSTREADMDREEKLLRKGKSTRRASSGQSGPTGQSAMGPGETEKLGAAAKSPRSPRLGSRPGLDVDGDGARAEPATPVPGASPGISPKLPRWQSSGGLASSRSPTSQSRPLPAPPDEYDSPMDTLTDPLAAAGAAAAAAAAVIAKRDYEPLYAQVADVLGLPGSTSRTPEPMPRRFSGSPSMQRRSSLGNGSSSMSAEIEERTVLTELSAAGDPDVAASPGGVRGDVGSPPKPSRKAPPPPMPPPAAGTGTGPARRSTWSTSEILSPRGSMDKGGPPASSDPCATPAPRPFIFFFFCCSTAAYSYGGSMLTPTAIHAGSQL